MLKEEPFLTVDDIMEFSERYNLEGRVIVKKSSPKNLSADCRSTVGRQLTDRLPTG